MSEQVERPMFRLEKVCYNCRFYKRKSTKISRMGFCTVNRAINPEIKNLPREEQKLHYLKTSIDSTCDWHQFKGGEFSKKPGYSCGAYPMI